MADFRQHSHSEWSNMADAKAYPGNTEIVIGCLQRIADALEKMERRLDPEWRRQEAIRVAAQRVEHADSDRRRENYQLWSPIEKPARAVIEGAMKSLAGFYPDAKKRAYLRSLDHRIFWKLVKPLIDFDRPPTPDDAEAVAAAVRSFDPLTFDWGTLSIGKIRREHLAVAIEAARAAQPPAVA